MRAITEERLILLRNNLAETGKNKEACLIDYLITDVVKEIDTLTVSKLLDVADAPRVGKFLVMLNTLDAFHECNFAADGRIRIGSMLFRSEYCVGWLPMPIFKPELAGNGE